MKKLQLLKTFEFETRVARAKARVKQRLLVVRAALITGIAVPFVLGAHAAFERQQESESALELAKTARIQAQSDLAQLQVRYRPTAATYQLYLATNFDVAEPLRQLEGDELSTARVVKMELDAIKQSGALTVYAPEAICCGSRKMMVGRVVGCSPPLIGLMFNPVVGSLLSWTRAQHPGSSTPLPAIGLGGGGAPPAARPRWA